MLLDNNGFIGDKIRRQKLSFTDRDISSGSTFTISVIAMAAVGILPGIPALM